MKKFTLLVAMIAILAIVLPVTANLAIRSSMLAARHTLSQNSK